MPGLFKKVCTEPYQQGTGSSGGTNFVHLQRITGFKRTWILFVKLNDLVPDGSQEYWSFRFLLWILDLRLFIAGGFKGPWNWFFLDFGSRFSFGYWVRVNQSIDVYKRIVNFHELQAQKRLIYKFQNLPSVS